MPGTLFIPVLNNAICITMSAYTEGQAYDNACEVMSEDELDEMTVISIDADKLMTFIQENSKEV